MIETERLLLRHWRDDDLPALHAIQTEPEVDYWLARGQPSLETNCALLDRMRRQIEATGWGKWAVVERASGDLLGAVGMQPTPPALPCSPAVEAGWWLRAASVGQGLITEAMHAALADWWSRPLTARGGHDAVVAFTADTNLRSQAVMRRLGFTHRPQEDFDHPALPADHPLRRHVLFRLDPPSR